jgi:hypothetical protein
LTITNASSLRFHDRGVGEPKDFVYGIQHNFIELLFGFREFQAAGDLLDPPQLLRYGLDFAVEEGVT